VDDRPSKTTHAQRRRKESQDAVRRKLQASQFIRRLREIAVKAQGVSASEVPALKLQADIYSRLLNKCLPDLKAIEHTGELRHADVSSQPLTDQEWAAKHSGMNAEVSH
jgi:hypothetical protein